MTNDDEGGGVTIPPKNDDVIYEQPLIPNAHQAKMCYINKDSQKQHLRCYIERPKHSVNEIDLELVW